MNKIIDKNGRLFGLISVIDVLVILIVILLAVALRTKTTVLDPTGATTGNTPITFEAIGEMIPNYVANVIAVGDTVYDKDNASGGAIGVITEVEILPASRAQELSNGTVVLVTGEEQCNVRIVVEGAGLIDESGRYWINRVYEIGVNGSRNFTTKYAEFKADMQSVW